jgi:hypothetical protein
VVHHHTTVVAPTPMFGGFGWGMPFGGFGWGGFAMRPAIVMPFGFFGGILQMMLLLLIGGMVFGFVKVRAGFWRRGQVAGDAAARAAGRATGITPPTAAAGCAVGPDK